MYHMHMRASGNKSGSVQHGVLVELTWQHYAHTHTHTHTHSHIHTHTYTPQISMHTLTYIHTNTHPNHSCCGYPGHSERFLNPLYMHCITAKKLALLPWLDSTNSSKRNYISSHSALIDYHLKSLPDNLHYKQR